MGLVKWAALVVWLGSWDLMYLEITRWRHVKPNLAFNPDPVIGNGMWPRPGLPLMLLYLASAVAPFFTVIPPVTVISWLRW